MPSGWWDYCHAEGTAGAGYNVPARVGRPRRDRRAQAARARRG